MQNLMKDKINKTREYLDYIEEHYDNVQKAFEIFTEKCSDLDIVIDEEKYNDLKKDVELHDSSKLSLDEFILYREKFFPTKYEEKTKDELKSVIVEENIISSFKEAWQHHKIYNNHHWQTWTNKRYWNDDYSKEVHCAHMVIDWMAMGMKFNDTARNYYESNKNDIDIPDWAVDFIYEIFDRVYGEVE